MEKKNKKGCELTLYAQIKKEFNCHTEGRKCKSIEKEVRKTRERKMWTSNIC